jgi:hypothetical protein
MRKLFVAILALAVCGFVAAEGMAPEITGYGYYRYEINDNTFDFESDGPTDSAEWTEYLIRIGLDWQLTDNTRFYVAPQFWSFFGDTPGFSGMGFQVSETDAMQLHEGYLEVKDMKDFVSLKLGRQTSPFGNGFIIGNPDFYAGQAFDGIRLDFHAGENGSIAVFDYKLRETAGLVADDASLYGVYGSWKVWEKREFDAYIMYWRDRSSAAGLGNLSLPTFGLRFSQPTTGEGWDWSAEFAYQSGEWDDMDVDQEGFGFEGWVGYTWSNNLRLALKGAWYEGDDDFDDPDFNSFLNPMQDYNNRYGRYDYLTSPFGIIGQYWNAVGTGTTAVGGRILSLTLDYKHNDSWMWGGALTWLGADSDMDAEDLGMDDPSSTVAWGLDGYVKYSYNDYLSWLLSASYLDADEDWTDFDGDGDSDSAMRAYLHANLKW